MVSTWTPDDTRMSMANRNFEKVAYLHFAGSVGMHALTLSSPGSPLADREEHFYFTVVKHLVASRRLLAPKKQKCLRWHSAALEHLGGAGGSVAGADGTRKPGAWGLATPLESFLAAVEACGAWARLPAPREQRDTWLSVNHNVPSYL